MERFTELTQSFDLIPVCLEVEADLDTPITAFWKLREGSHSFLLESVEGGETWARYTLMGSDPKRVFRVRNGRLTITGRCGEESTHSCSDPLSELFRRVACTRIHQPDGLPRFFGGLVGGIAYDSLQDHAQAGTSAEPGDTGPPDMVFFETDVVLVWDNLKHRANLIALARTDGRPAVELWDEARAALEKARVRLAAPLQPLPRVNQPAGAISCSVESEAFQEKVARAKDSIRSGDAIQIVISREFNQPACGLHPFLVYRSLRGLNPSPYMFYLEAGDLSLVGASPEVMVRRTGDRIDVRPIAGTRRRGADAQEDAELAVELLADPKELAEHVMLVDLARNDVGRVARTGTVIVEEQMVIERYSHVMHLVSHVTGQSNPSVSPGELIRSTFPAGTLSGAPKRRAMQIIAELEGDRRGYYGGAVGTIGPDGDMDLCIAIRMLSAFRGTFSVRAGAGVVYDSDPLSETLETESKARAVLLAIEEARKRFWEDPS